MTLFLIVTCILCAWVLLGQIGTERAKDLAQLKQDFANRAEEESKKLV
jgi:hypothetical protein